MYARHLTARLRAALSDTPVVTLAGPRQSGKTTLARAYAKPATAFVSLDDPPIRAAATADPVGVLRDFSAASTLVIDEIQLVPELLSAIKLSVDIERRPGRFLLTGSAQLLALPRVHESLAGRMEVVTLYPLSRGEIAKHKPHDFLARIFTDRLGSPKAPVVGGALIEAVLAGGFPEAIGRTTPRRRSDWHRAYVASLIERDIRDIATVDNARAIRELASALALVSGQLVGWSTLGARLGVDHKTVKRYSGLLEQIFLVSALPAWHSNELKRVVSTAKLHFIDSGLLATLSGVSADKLQRNRKLAGPLCETFVFSELLKCASWSAESVRLFHYRDKDQVEVDFVLENASGEIVGIEVKAAATVGSDDFRGLRRLQTAHGDRFVRGVVLYDGDRTLSFGDRLQAAPFACLWS